MDNRISTLLTDVYEIEGLLLVVSRHGKDTPPQVYERIKKAASLLNEQCRHLGEEAAAPASVVTPQPPVFVPEPEINKEDELIEDEPQQVPVEDREPDDDITVEFIYDDDEEPSQDDEAVEPSQQSDDDMPAAPFAFTEPIPVADQAQEDEADDESYIVVRRDPAKDLRKSLSLNDYYRFRRELFQGNEEAMNSALDHIEEMQSMEEVERYFLGELEWDTASEDVKYFMEIVNNLFA